VRRRRGLVVWALAGAFLWSLRAHAQEPPAPEALPRPPSLPLPAEAFAGYDAPATQTGFAPLLTPLPEQKQRTADEVTAFLQGLSTKDSTFEVLVGEGRVLTLKEDLAVPGKPRPLIAVGDPSVVDMVIIGPRQIRVIGQRIGATDLSITTSTGTVYAIDVQVVADLNILRCQLKALFPDASLRLAQIRDHVVVEGQARDTAEVTRIIHTIRAYLLSVQATQSRRITGQSTATAVPPAGGRGAPGGRPAAGPETIPPPGNGAPAPGGDAGSEAGQLSVSTTLAEPQIINLIRVVGSQQVLLKVLVAELNRTAMREVGADWLATDPEHGIIVGTQIGGAGISATSTITRGLTATATGTTSPTTTAFAIFQQGGWEVFLRALRRNLILRTLAEPDLVTMNGHLASFLAGGEFPVPVPQVGASGVAPTVTVQFKEFGVRLTFLPYVLDGDVIRLTVDPEVSDIDRSLGTTLVAGGTPVPGLNSRKAHTTVELRQGQTLMIAGLLQVSIDGQTSRIPGLGDLPVLGPFFSNTTNQRVEKELVVLVTPYLVEPMNPEQVPPYPGAEVNEPNDLEAYFFGRIEGRTGRPFRSTTSYDDPLHLLHRANLEKKYMVGPCGFSE
jgi:pilus assembly protein CpaC